MKKQIENSEAFGALTELLDQALQYRDELSSDRSDAQALYDGNLDKWLKSKKGRSSVISDDVKATINKVLPGIVRTILGNEIVADYGAQSQEDEQGAQQATEFINLVLLDECRARKAIYSAIYDALKIRNGILHVFAEEKVEVRGSSHTGIDMNALSAIMSEEGVQVLEHEEKPGPVDPQTGQPAIDQMGQPVTLHDIKIKRVTKRAQPKMAAIPMEEYLIDPNATNSHEDASLVGREYLLKRSDLVAMYPEQKERIAELSQATYDPTQEGEKLLRRKNSWLDKLPGAEELHQIQVYDLYVRLDFDDDGIAELRHVMLCGGKTEEYIFENEYADFVPYYDVVCEELPHQWEGRSITDHVAQIMLAKTALLRGFQDNVYLVNDPQPVVNVRLKNPDALLNREPGRPLFVDGSDRAQDAVSYNVVPFIGDKAMMGIGYWDKQIVDRAGIDDSSAGMAPDALQNVTAKASAMLEQKGIAKTELITRTIAECLKGPFAGLLKLTIQHSDKARMVRLRNKYVEVDPKSWNADMDVNINTGLGTGTRERDMMVMQGILATQERVYTQLGESPVLGLKNISNTLRKSVQAAGITVADPFFPSVDDQALEQHKQAQAQQKPIELQKIEAQAMADAQLKKQELEMTLPFELQHKQIDVQAAKEKEIAQGQAAVDQAIAQAQIDSQSKQEELALKRYEIDLKAQIEREKMAHDAKLAQDTNHANIQKEQAKSFGDSITKQNEEATKPAKDAGPQLLELVKSLQETVKAANAPKRIIRDKNGDIAGVEAAA